MAALSKHEQAVQSGKDNVVLKSYEFEWKVFRWKSCRGKTVLPYVSTYEASGVGCRSRANLQSHATLILHHDGRAILSHVIGESYFQAIDLQSTI